MSVIVGMGSGRCGTTSLARLISAQDNAVCFHELDPAVMSWDLAENVVRSRLEEFRALLAGGPRELTGIGPENARSDEALRLSELPQLAAVGDVGLYYLMYVPLLVQLSTDIRLPCLRRDRAETVESYRKKMRVHTRRRFRRIRSRRRNHFVKQRGWHWILDDQWDKCYPKFGALTLRGAIGMYWDHYYEVAERYAVDYPEQFRIFEMSELNSPEGQRRILEFCGFDDPRLETLHTNASR